MEGVELKVQPSALRSIAKLAMQRKTGARGLRSIVERALLETMFRLPDIKEQVKTVVIDETVINDNCQPKLLTADGQEYQLP